MGDTGEIAGQIFETKSAAYRDQQEALFRY